LLVLVLVLLATCLISGRHLPIGCGAGLKSSATTSTLLAVPLIACIQMVLAVVLVLVMVLVMAVLVLLVMVLLEPVITRGGHGSKRHPQRQG
jgi:hypothetical protein